PGARRARAERRLDGFRLFHSARFGERAVPALFRDVEEVAFGIKEFALEIQATGIPEIHRVLPARFLDYGLRILEVVDHEAEMVDAHPAIRGRRAGPVYRIVAQHR